MDLKRYQTRVLDEFSAYLAFLKKKRDEYESLQNNPDKAVRQLASRQDFSKDAWDEYIQGLPKYHPKKDGLGNPMPDVYVKVPTGGGKTLLAVHAIDKINREYLNRNAGLTLWIVPTEQIYRQTLQQLKDRAHPYRQLLEIASGGRVLVRERRQIFKPTDCSNQHVILLLMLPAANRANKETLRMFKDSGGFDEFFPPEDDAPAHKALLEKTPNLDYFGSSDDLIPPQVKSSLGNVLRLQRPLVVVDEGQKAYSAQARETISGFNPSFILELSATPPRESNIIAQVSGRELDREEMIKLDINLTNQKTPDWKQTLLVAVRKRQELEEIACERRQNALPYIRPIALVQVERTGKDKRDNKHVHSEDARDYLISQCNILPHEIAIKSSDNDELANTDLLSEQCPIRYIITSKALQEGWDCSFAYVLAVLSNLSARTAMTQLIGRVLRQPYAQKTKVRALDECYIFTHRSDSRDVAGAIKKDLEKEGLGDISGHINTLDDNGDRPSGMRKISTAEKFKHFAGKVYLPQFVAMEKKRPRPLDYQGDLMANLNWEKLSAPGLFELSLADSTSDLKRLRIGLSKERNGDLQVREGQEDYYAGLSVDPVLVTRQLMDIIPNPWIAYKKVRQVLDKLLQREKKRGMINDLSPQARLELNFIFIIEEMKRQFTEARDRMAEEYFKKQVSNGKIQLMLISCERNDFRIPPNVYVRSKMRMNRADGTNLRRSLFDYVPDEDINDWERCVALYLDEQEQLLWWYRNQVKDGYAIQGWKPHRIYPDFIAAKSDDSKERRKKYTISKVLVLEMKGQHLKGNEDTQYKDTMLGFCTKLCETTTAKPKLHRWGDLAKDFSDCQFRFQLVNQDGWKDTINSLLGD